MDTRIGVQRWNALERLLGAWTSRALASGSDPPVPTRVWLRGLDSGGRRAGPYAS